VVQVLFGDPSLVGRHIVVDGVGKVGSSLARKLAGDGAHLTIADIRREVAEELAADLGADIVAPEEALTVPCDVLAPCALGPVVTDATIDAFKCKAIAGAANNQLETPGHGRALAEAGILYAPDYVINAGGLINVEDELHGYDPARAHAKAEHIADTLREVFAIAERDGLSPSDAADRLAEIRIRSARATG
jgi:leucine dehydrogenase